MNDENDLNKNLLEVNNTKKERKHVKSILKKTLIKENNKEEKNSIRNIIVNKKSVVYKSLIDNDKCLKEHDQFSSLKKEIHGINEDSIEIKVHKVENWKEKNKQEMKKSNKCCNCIIF